MPFIAGSFCCSDASNQCYVCIAAAIKRINNLDTSRENARHYCDPFRSVPASNPTIVKHDRVLLTIYRIALTSILLVTWAPYLVCNKPTSMQSRTKSELRRTNGLSCMHDMDLSLVWA